MVYSRPFASKAVFWAILNEFEFAVDCSIYKKATLMISDCSAVKVLESLNGKEEGVCFNIKLTLLILC